MIKHTYLQRTLLSILISTSMVLASPVHAQSTVNFRPLSTGFLLDFAQKLFDRGEYDEAKTLLERMLKSDPQNTSAQRLLKTVKDQKASPSEVKDSRPSDIASDIILIQKNVVLFEHRNRDLEFAIRKTLQENIFLYQTLSRRNHELLELRKKFFGYDSTALPTASMQKTVEIINGYQDQIKARDREFMKRNQDIALKMKDVTKAGDALKEEKQLQKADSAINAVEWKNDLSEKRSYLVEKVFTLYEKNKDLSVLHSELTAVSKSLKEANESYGETVEEYETKIQKLNTVWVQDKAKQESEIDQLKDQIKNEKVKVMSARLSPIKDKAAADKSKNAAKDSDVAKTAADKTQKQDKAEKAKKEPEVLVKDTASKASVVEEKKSKAESKAEEKAKEKVSVNEKTQAAESQAEIKRLEAELAKKEKELSERSRMFDATVRQLKASWANDKTAALQNKTEEQAVAVVKTSEVDVSKVPDQYKEMAQELVYVKEQLSTREDQLQKIQNEVLDHTSQMEALQSKLDERDKRLTDMDALIATKDEQITALKKQLVAQITVIQDQSRMIKELQLAKNTGLQDMGKRTVDVSKKPSAGGPNNKSVEELRGLVAELENNLTADSKGAAKDVNQQLISALKTVQEKDREIKDLKLKLEESDKLADLRSSAGDKKAMDSRVRGYEQMVADLKTRLAKADDERREADKNWKEATKKLSAMVESSKKSKVDDTSAKRLNELTKKISELTSEMDQQTDTFELQFKTLRDKISQKDAQIADLKVQLAAKEKQVQQFYDTMQKATQKLNKQSLSQGQQPTAPAWSDQKTAAKPAPVKDKDQKEWNPADNDAYGLQQRLNTLSKELKFTQDELASRTKEKGDLQQKLNAKEASSAKLVIGKEQDDMTQKNIVKLENELAEFRQQSDLTKTTIRLQQASLAKSQKEVDRKEKSLRAILEQSEKLKKQSENYKATIKEKDDQIASQRKALDHEIKKNQTLIKKLHDIDATIGEEQEQNAEKGQSVKDLKNTLGTYEIRERDYKKQIEDIQGQLKTSYSMIKDGESRISELKKRLDAREERITTLEKELNHLKVQDSKADSSQTAGQEK